MRSHLPFVTVAGLVVGSLALVVCFSMQAQASTSLSLDWNVILEGEFGGTSPFEIDFDVATDASGRAQTSLSDVPVTVLADGVTFSITAGGTFTDAAGCEHRISLTGNGPIQATTPSSASGPLVGADVTVCPTGSSTRSITGFFDAIGRSSSVTVVTIFRAQTVSGTVTVETIAGLIAALVAGVGVGPGSAVHSGADGSATLTLPGVGTTLGVAASTEVAFLPPDSATGDTVVLSQIKGLLTHSLVNLSPSQPDRYRVSTPTVTVRPRGTAFTTQYSQTGSIGSTVVSVQSGTLEVTNRRGQLVTLTEGMQVSFDDSVPRVIPILPVDRDAGTAGAVTTFSWTQFPGAAGYLFEYTLNPAFAQPNPGAPESLRNAILLLPPAFTQTDGRVEFAVRLPAGLVAPTAPASWRVFAVDATGAVLQGTTASDASRLFIQ